jgi:MFS family permease
MRIALLAGTASIPFMTVYAKRVLLVSDSFIGSLVSVTLAASLLSNPLWARLSDRRSNKLVMLITTSMGLVYCIAAAFVTSAAAGLPLEVGQGLLMMMFIISGAMLAGMNLVSMPLMIEISEPTQQSLYFGLSNTVLGIVLLSTAGVGLIVDQFGFLALYIFSGFAFALALERLSGLRDPRHQP